MKAVLRWMLARLGEFLRFFYVIFPFEMYCRIRDRLNPKLYSRNARIISCADGSSKHHSNKFAIFVIFTKAEIPAYTQTAISALNEVGANIVFVSNGKLPPLARRQLLDSGRLVIERANIGRDFGAYKDGLTIIQEKFKDVDRVIFMNDSIYYFPYGLKRIFEELMSDKPFVGLTEVFEHHYHVQSYLLSVGREVLENKYFQRYWRRYLPISTRRWSIHKGEVGLTKVITKKAGFAPYIICNAGMLREHLQAVDIMLMPSVIDILPTIFRRELMHKLRSMIEERTRDFALARVLGAVGGADAARGSTQAPSIFIGDRGDSEIPSLPSPLQTEMKEEVDRVKEILKRVDELNFQDLIDFIINFIAQRNQSHWGGALFIKFLNVPIIKRDVVYRESYQFEEFMRVLDLLELPFKDEIAADLRRKGLSTYYRGFKYVLYKSGTI